VPAVPDRPSTSSSPSTSPYLYPSPSAHILHSLPSSLCPWPRSTADNRLIKSEKSAKFGTAQQRPDVPKESLCKPGAVYTLPSTLSTQTVSFGTVGAGCWSVARQEGKGFNSDKA
jgi:hypothetical protein